MTIFERTKEVTRQRGLSLQEVAKRAGIGINSIYAWKEKDPSITRLQAVADVLHVSTAYLLGEDDKQADSIDIETDPVILSFDGTEIDEEDKQAMIDLLMARRARREREGK